MATTTANKSGLRAAAEAKRTKAAQRTELPPKRGTKAAEAPVEETKPAKRTRKAVTPPPSLTEVARKTPKAKAAELALAEAAKLVPVKPAKEEAAKADKGTRYAGELGALGWKSEVSHKDGLVELTATRGAEALFLSWFNEAHISGGSTYTYADRTVKVRNPAEAVRLASRQPEEAKATQAKVSTNKQFVKRATGPTVRSVPFDVETATEEEIVAAIGARSVSWHNQYRVESETATVGTLIRVDRHRGGHRIVSFVDPQFGFRAFKLENLENVGRKVNLERIKQEILASLTRGEKSGRK